MTTRSANGHEVLRSLPSVNILASRSKEVLISYYLQLVRETAEARRHCATLRRMIAAEAAVF